MGSDDTFYYDSTCELGPDSTAEVSDLVYSEDDTHNMGSTK